MKNETKARWTAKTFAPRHLGDEKRVGFTVTIHNLAELGFKQALRVEGEEYSQDFDIPLERYLAMSKEEKNRQCEEFVREMLRMLTDIENGHKRFEETARMISEEIITGQASVLQVKEERPLKIIDKESVQKIVTEAKKLIYESPDMQKVLTLKEVLSVAENYGLDEKWISTVGYLLVEEIALRQWLVQHDHDKQDVKKIRAYYKLLEMVEQDFENMGKTLNAREVAKFLGEREFRNRVLHWGYKPTPEDAKETKEMAIGLLEFLKQH